MYTKQQAIEFAVSSACVAIDQACAYGGLANSIAEHRDNGRDTLNDERSAEHEPDAFDAYDAKIAQILSTL